MLARDTGPAAAVFRYAQRSVTGKSSRMRAQSIASLVCATIVTLPFRTLDARLCAFYLRSRFHLAIFNRSLFHVVATCRAARLDDQGFLGSARWVSDHQGRGRPRARPRARLAALGLLRAAPQPQHRAPQAPRDR